MHLTFSIRAEKRANQLKKLTADRLRAFRAINRSPMPVFRIIGAGKQFGQ